MGIIRPLIQHYPSFPLPSRRPFPSVPVAYKDYPDPLSTILSRRTSSAGRFVLTSSDLADTESGSRTTSWHKRRTTGDDGTLTRMPRHSTTAWRSRSRASPAAAEPGGAGPMIEACPGARLQVVPLPTPPPPLGGRAVRSSGGSSGGAAPGRGQSRSLAELVLGGPPGCAFM